MKSRMTSFKRNPNLKILLKRKEREIFSKAIKKSRDGFLPTISIHLDNIWNAAMIVFKHH